MFIDIILNRAPFIFCFCCFVFFVNLASDTGLECVKANCILVLGFGEGKTSAIKLCSVAAQNYPKNKQTNKRGFFVQVLLQVNESALFFFQFSSSLVFVDAQFVFLITFNSVLDYSFTVQCISYDSEIIYYFEVKFLNCWLVNTFQPGHLF